MFPHSGPTETSRRVLLSASRLAITCYVVVEGKYVALRRPLWFPRCLTCPPRGLPRHLALQRPGSSSSSFVRPSLGAHGRSAPKARWPLPQSPCVLGPGHVATGASCPT